MKLVILADTGNSELFRLTAGRGARGLRGRGRGRSRHTSGRAKPQPKPRQRGPGLPRQIPAAAGPAEAAGSGVVALLSDSNSSPSSASEGEAAAAAASDVNELRTAPVPAPAPAAAPGRTVSSVAARFEKPLEAEAIDIDRRVKTDGHQAIVDVALPYLRQVMLDESFCVAPARDQVRQALFRVDMAGKRFWGQSQLYSRKRTVEDAMIQYYVDAVRAKL